MELNTLVGLHRRWCCSVSVLGVISCPWCRLLGYALPFYLCNHKAACWNQTHCPSDSTHRNLRAQINSNGHTKGWEGVCAVFLCVRVCLSFHFGSVWSSVIAASFQSKKCWQLSIVIKSHVAKPSVYQLRISVKLKVAWACVGALLNDNERNGIYVCWCACATATRGSPQCHSQSEFVTGVWQAPQEDCLMCWYRQECFLKVFCREEEEEEKEENK